MSRFDRLLGLLFVWTTLLGPSAAFAEEPNEHRTTIPDGYPPAASLPKKRPVPDYDGRAPKPPDVEESLLWIPRVLLAPLYLATEFLIRRPLGAIVTALERSDTAQRFISTTTMGTKKNIGFSPTLYIDYGVQPVVGAYAFWDNAGSRQNHVRAYVATFGEPLFLATLADRYDLGRRSAVSMRAALTHRSDDLFYGIGPSTTTRTKSRYEETTWEGGPVFDLAVRRGVELHTRAGLRDTTYSDGTCCGTPALRDVVRSGALPPPPRLEDGGYSAVFEGANVILDSRAHLHASGARVALVAAPTFDVRKPDSWVRYSAEGTAYWDITGTARVLHVGASAMFVDPLEGAANGIPFNEYVSLGGTGPMRGFLPGRLYDRSAAVATVGYEWPIWAYLNAMLEGAVGNVFGAGLRDFDLDKLRLSGVAGIRSNTSPDHQFELIGGFGTDTFAQGTRVTSGRFAIGWRRAF